jgi:hypothetical protein
MTRSLELKFVTKTERESEREQEKCGQGCREGHCIVATAVGESEVFPVLMVPSLCPLVLIVKLNVIRE